MIREEFLTELQNRLAGLPQEDIDERIDFYREMIEDRIEEGTTEEEAIEEIGTVDSVVNQIMSEMPLTKLVKEKVKQKRELRVWEIVLLVLGSPVWIPLIAAAVIIILALYVVIWAAVFCLYAADIAAAAVSVYGIISIFIYLKAGNVAGMFFGAGTTLFCAGCTILLFFASVWITKYVLKLSKNILLRIKTLFIRRRGEI